MSRFITAVCLSFLLIYQSHAAEGFWLQQQLAAELPSSELTQQPGQKMLNQLSKNVIRVGKCTAAFVSDDGLLLTSARCIAPYLTQPLDHTFAASTPQEEIPLNGLTAFYYTESQDVTVSINRQLNDAGTALARAQQLAQIEREYVSRCQQQGRHCLLRKRHYGLQFSLQYYQPYTDVRLVYLPLQNTSQQQQLFWPRYDADFTLLRVYTADGKAYNAPHSRLTDAGVSEQQQIIVPDFVPRSQRYSSATELEFLFGQLYPQKQQQIKRTLNLLNELEQAGYDSTSALKTSLTQQYQQRQAKLDEYQSGHMIKQRQHQQQRLSRWIESSSVRQQLYGPVLARLQQLQQQQQQMSLRDQVLENVTHARLPALASQLYQHALTTDSVARRAQKQRLEQKLIALEQGFDARLDQALALHFLELYAELPANLRLPALDQYFALNDGFNRDIVRHKLSAIYRITSLTLSRSRYVWLDAAPDRFKNSDDPLISFAVAMQETMQQLTEQRQQLTVELEMAKAALMEVLVAFNDANNKATYAEANGELRFSVGRISGYHPQDAVWYLPFSRITTSAQVRSSGVQVNFLSDVDSCGEVTGAPTFNLKGQLVGVMYTATGQRQLARWHYEAELSRSVHVDSRFIVWHMQQTEAGRRLLQKLLPAKR